MEDIGMSLNNKEEIKKLNEGSLLITGSAAHGKTRTIKELIPNFIFQNKKVIIIDVYHEYSQLVRLLDGTSIKANEIDGDFSEVDLLHVRFEHDKPTLTGEAFNSFKKQLLSKLKSFDYLVVDEADCLLDHLEENNLTTFRSFVSESLIINSAITFIFATESIIGLPEDDLNYLNHIFPHNFVVERSKELV
jgi:Cdc6-like AAA superfamily ATPase